MLYLAEAEVRQLLTPELAFAAVEEAHRLLAEKRANDTARERTQSGKVMLHILQGALPTLGVIGYKAYTTSPQGARFYVHLFSANSGEPLAVMEADALGQFRTAAAAAVAARALARAKSHVLALVGSGWQAQGHLRAMAKIFPLDQVRVYSRRRDALEKFCAALSAELALPVKAMMSAEAAVEGADLITTLTFSSTPVLLGQWIPAGAHLTAAGSNALTRQELDEDAVRRCSLIAVDTVATALKESGDIHPLIKKGALQPQQLVELGDLLTHRHPGRQKTSDITLFCSQGLAVQDLALAARVLALAREKNMGRQTPV